MSHQHPKQSAGQIPRNRREKRRRPVIVYKGRGKGGNKEGREPTPEEQSGFLSPLFIKSLSFCAAARRPFLFGGIESPPLPEQKMAPGQRCDHEPETKSGSNSKMGPGEREGTDNYPQFLVHENSRFLCAKSIRNLKQ